MCALWPWRYMYDLGSRSWHTIGLWTTIVWNIIPICQRVKKLWTWTKTWLRLIWLQGVAAYAWLEFNWDLCGNQYTTLARSWYTIVYLTESLSDIIWWYGTRLGIGFENDMYYNINQQYSATYLLTLIVNDNFRITGGLRVFFFGGGGGQMRRRMTSYWTCWNGDCLWCHFEERPCILPPPPHKT